MRRAAVQGSAACSSSLFWRGARVPAPEARPERVWALSSPSPQPFPLDVRATRMLVPFHAVRPSCARAFASARAAGWTRRDAQVRIAPGWDERVPCAARRRARFRVGSLGSRAVSQKHSGSCQDLGARMAPEWALGISALGISESRRRGAENRRGDATRRSRVGDGVRRGAVAGASTSARACVDTVKDCRVIIVSHFFDSFFDSRAAPCENLLMADNTRSCPIVARPHELPQP